MRGGSFCFDLLLDAEVLAKGFHLAGEFRGDGRLPLREVVFLRRVGIEVVELVAVELPAAAARPSDRKTMHSASRVNRREKVGAVMISGDEDPGDGPRS
jgi:hypothetical protein